MQLAGNLSVEFPRRSAQADNAWTMIGPKHRGRGVTAQPELRGPKPPGQTTKRTTIGRQPIAMKRNVACFVAKNEVTHRLQPRNPAMTLQQPIIGGARDLGQQQDLQFEANAQDPPALAKCCEAPV